MEIWLLHTASLTSWQTVNKVRPCSCDPDVCYSSMWLGYSWKKTSPLTKIGPPDWSYSFCGKVIMITLTQSISRKRVGSWEMCMCWWLPQIARFMGPTWGPSEADRTMLAPWALLSGGLYLGYILPLIPNSLQISVSSHSNHYTMIAIKFCWLQNIPDSKVHRVNMGAMWTLLSGILLWDVSARIVAILFTENE